MTESLKSLMERQAASVAFKPPDLDAIARDNNRRVLRRRMVTLVAGVATVAVVASSAVVLSSLASRGPDVVAGPGPDAVSWATGSTIHHGADTIDVGHPVRAYVRTSVGFITVDDADNVYSVTGQGGVTMIGKATATGRDGTQHVRLVSDPRGTLAGWLDADGSELVLRVHDQATGQTRGFGTAGAAFPGGADFFAIDGRTAYWGMATRGVFAVNVDTGDERQLADVDQGQGLKIWSVENGVLAFSRNQPPRGNVTAFRVGRSVDDAREFTFGEDTEASDQILLSPTGAWVGYLLYEFNGPPVQDDVRAFTPQVRDTATGEPVTLNLPTSFVVPVVWIDDTTMQFLVLSVAPDNNSARAFMYACTVPGGSCGVAAELPLSAVDGSNLVLPNGVGQ